MSSKAARQQQLRQYFQNQLNPIFQPLIYNLIKHRPEDLLQYCIRSFKPQNRDSQSDNSDDQQRFQDITQQQFKLWKNKRRIVNPPKKRRDGVGRQAGKCNKRKVISLIKGSPLNDQTTQMKILFLFMNSFLFNHFDQEGKALLIENMTKRDVVVGQKVVVEGEYGDQMYFVKEGLFECYKNTAQGKKVLKNYKSGDSFGELCVLHSSVRSTTIEAKTNGQLFCLPRRVYKHIKTLQIVKKRQYYSNSLKKVNIFENLNSDELQKIIDVLTEITYDAGKTVIIEGDTGNKFYIVIEGVLVASKGKSQKVVQMYKDGDYFGQLALLNDTPRQATIKTVTKSTLVYLTQDVFKKIVNRQKIERQISYKYKQNSNLLNKKR